MIESIVKHIRAEECAHSGEELYLKCTCVMKSIIYYTSSSQVYTEAHKRNDQQTTTRHLPTKTPTETCGLSELYLSVVKHQK